MKTINHPCGAADSPDAEIVKNDRGGYSILVYMIADAMAVGNYATEVDAREAAFRSGLKVEPPEVPTRVQCDCCGSFTPVERAHVVSDPSIKRISLCPTCYSRIRSIDAVPVSVAVA
jgi:hypothetical protein